MSMDYGMNPLMMGNYDWYSMLPYMQKVLQTPNPNFKGSADNTSKTNTAQNVKSNPPQTQTNDGAIPVTTPPEEEGSSTLSTLTGIGAVLAIGGGALYMLKKGNFGKASDVVKSMFNSGKGETSPVSNILKRLTAVKGNDNKIRFLIPGKTTTATGETAIADLTRRYGIETSVQGERLAYSPANSVVESFRYTAAGEKFTVHTKDGVITKIVDEKGNEVLKRFTEAQEKSADALTYQKMDSALKELVKEEKEIDKALFAGVENIQYVNTYGDDVIKAYLQRYGTDPRIKQFTTLERFDFASKEMQELVLNADEKVFAEFAEKGLMTKNGRFSKARLAEGLKVSSFSKEINGNEYFFEEGQLVKIVKADKTVLLPNSSGYIQLEADNKKAIDGIIKNVFEERTEIPVGATIIPE